MAATAGTGLAGREHLRQTLAGQASRKRHWVRFAKDLGVRTGPLDGLPPQEILAALSRLPNWPGPGDGQHWRAPGRGVTAILAWLLQHQGGGWQERWLASGAEDDLGWLAVLPAESANTPGTRMAANRYGLHFLLLGRVVLPGYGFMSAYTGSPLFRNYQRAWWSADVIRRLDAAAAEFGMHQGSRTCGIRALTKIAIHTGLDLDCLTPDDFHEYREWSHQAYGHTAAGAWPAWDLLRGIGVFPASVSLRDAVMRGQKTPAELVDQYHIKAPGVRQVLIRYLTERQVHLDYNSLCTLAGYIVGLFWADIEAHHPGIDTLHLPGQVADAWKERLAFQKSKPGQPPRPRKSMHMIFTHVRALYLDIQQWAHQDPSWVPWAAPSPVRREDTAGQARRRQQVASEIHQRIRDRLPHLPALIASAEKHRDSQAGLLSLAKATPIGSTFSHDGKTYRRITSKQSVQDPARCAVAAALAEDPQTGERVDIASTEDDAFWTWAVIETLRHTGTRAEELMEITHMALISYRLPRTGELVPMLQIVPSKLDEERLLLISPELASVLASIITRLRERHGGTVPAISRWDPYERVASPVLPFLFQRTASHGYRSEVISHPQLKKMIADAMGRAGIRDAAGQPMRLTPHDFRRFFATEAVSSGLPIHIAARLLGHHSLATTQSYLAVFQDDLVRTYRAFLDQRRAMRPEAEYREPTDEEWREFQQHFERRKLELGDCGRPYGTPCRHEHACIRCPMLRIDPGQRPRLAEIIRNLNDRIAEARMNGWLGEVEGLQVSLQAAKAKLSKLKPASAPTASITDLGIPVIRQP
jgi:Phage integrase family